MLPVRYSTDISTIEIGVDEAGRGPMFGPVYAAAVVLPENDPEFPYKDMKDSKRFSSAKKIAKVADIIKEKAVGWGVASCDHAYIDKHNIRSATHTAMHAAIQQVLTKVKPTALTPLLLIDGNDFKPMPWAPEGEIGFAKHVCITKGDNKYASIAAASILAKVTRDQHILSLCEENPELQEHYEIAKNKGYGTANHMKGLREHGLSPYHRRTFGLCSRLSFKTKLIEDDADMTTHQSQ
jgi:ribonuclease HII